MQTPNDELMRAVGRSEGRIESLEKQVADAATRHARELADLWTANKEVNVKLDAILSKLNQGVGGLRAGMWIWQAAAAAGGFLAAHFWPGKP